MTTAPQILQALGEPRRWEIVGYLGGGACCVCELGEGLGLLQSSLSTHLQVLRAAGIVVGERRGRWMYYGIAEEVRPLLRALWRHLPRPAGPRAAARDCGAALAEPTLAALVKF